MPAFETKFLGPIAYDSESIIEFPTGMPGFECLRRFVALRVPESDPLIFLQSLEEASVCFIAAPVGVVDPGYRLEVSPEDLAQMELPASRQPMIGDDVLCLALLSARESALSANLLAPVLINLRNRKAVQAVSTLSEYSHRYELVTEAPAC